jgi:alkanesulfonate monooxygenase SsuD/methylene tetrahydromethanopterin reductase-like flavin-dependent oxidoreductase (luciferase family)
MGTFYNQLVRRYGFEAEAEAIAAAWAGGERRGVASLVTDAMVDALAVAGDPAACRERFAAYEAAGFDELILAVEAPDIERSLAAVEALAPKS